MPKWTAGLPLPGLGGALMLSMLAHGLALAWWLHARQIEQNAPSFGQKRGSLTVTIAPPAQAPKRPTQPIAAQGGQAPAPAPRVLAMQAAAVSHRHQVEQPTAPAATPASLPASSGLTGEPSPDPVEPRPAITAPMPATPEQPGARFASLFAPIISRPMGRGRWQARPATPAIDETSSAMQREQAIQGTRQALLQRLETIRPSLHQTPLHGRCAVRISLSQQAAQMDCTEQADLQRLSPQIGSVLALRPHEAPLQPESCLVLQQNEIRWQECPATTERTLPATAAASP